MNELLNRYSGTSFNISAVLLILIIIAPIGSSYGQSSTNLLQRYIVILQGEPTAKTFLRARITGPAQAAPANAAGAAKMRAAEIQAQHDLFSARLRALGVKEVARHSKLLNGISVKATPSQVKAIEQLPGVKSVHRAQIYELNTASSVPF